jgi:hypothetical protein
VQGGIKKRTEHPTVCSQNVSSNFFTKTRAFILEPFDFRVESHPFFGTFWMAPPKPLQYPESHLTITQTNARAFS